MKVQQTTGAGLRRRDVLKTGLMGERCPVRRTLLPSSRALGRPAPGSPGAAARCACVAMIHRTLTRTSPSTSRPIQR